MTQTRPTIRILPGHHKRVRTGHPWVYSNEIEMNAAAKALMPDSYRNNPAIFPPADVMAKCEYGAFEGAAKASFYEEVVTRVRAA